LDIEKKLCDRAGHRGWGAPISDAIYCSLVKKETSEGV
jgi:hypothetical protein